MAWYHTNKVVLRQIIVSVIFVTYGRRHWIRLIQYSMICIVAIVMWNISHYNPSFEGSKLRYVTTCFKWPCNPSMKVSRSLHWRTIVYVGDMLHLALDCKNVDHRNFMKLMSFISSGNLFYIPCIILPKTANMEQSQSLFTRGAHKNNFWRTTTAFFWLQLMSKIRQKIRVSGDPSRKNEIW